MTTKEQVKQALSSHRPDLDRFGVKRLAIFGSVVRGDDRSESDIDVLVEFTDETRQGDYFSAFMGLALFLERLFGRKVDLATPPMVRRFRAELDEEVFLA